MSTSITLNCLVLGEGSEYIFSVRIPVTDNVGILKEAIKEKKDLFNNVKASNLDLWKVSFPVDEHLETNILGMGFEKTAPLLAVKKLLGVFSGEFEDEHLHIVVQPPVSVIQTNEPPWLELNCWVFGEDPKDIFTVEIPSTKNVSILKKAIKDQMRPTFDHIAAITVALWRVSFPNDSDLKLKLSEFDLDDEKSLSPMEVLSSVFLQPPPQDQVHIIVRLPSAHLPPQPSRASESDTILWTEEEANEAIKAMDAIQRTGVEAAQTAPAPSLSSQFQKFLDEQRDRPIWNGRPSMNCGIPIQLYHPSFAKIIRVARGDAVEINLKPEAYSATHSLFHASAALYVGEINRIATTRFFLEGAIGHQLPPEEFPCGDSSMRPDGALTQTCGSVRALVVVKEDTNEIGTGGCDPSHQCSMSYRSYYVQKKMKLIRESCCCPSFLIAFAGPWMCILGAVYAESPVIQQLTDFIWIGGHPYDNHKLKLVARILASLGTGISELQEFYSKLPRLYNPQRFFPFVRHYSVEGRVVNFSYMTYLFPITPDTPKSPSKAIFRAMTETDVGRRNIIVKFTQRYNAEAHRHLATKHHAPELLYCSEEDPDSADLAGLIMVVMEDIDGGETAYQKYGNCQLDQPIFDQVAEAIGVLHGKNIVFGDLRYPNIMITKDQRVRLVDFDWCGEHGKDTYPGSLNVNRDTTNSIDWHRGVERGGKMMKEHDIFMLNKMKPRSEDIPSLPITSLPNPPPATTSFLGKRKTRSPGDDKNEGEDM